MATAATPAPDLISVRQAAELANVAPVTIYRAIHRGEVEAVRVGEQAGPLRINRARFLEWLHGPELPDEAA
jgi:excisionase family DNA binding protein